MWCKSTSHSGGRSGNGDAGCLQGRLCYPTTEEAYLRHHIAHGDGDALVPQVHVDGDRRVVMSERHHVLVASGPIVVGEVLAQLDYDTRPHVPDLGAGRHEEVVGISGRRLPGGGEQDD